MSPESYRDAVARVGKRNSMRNALTSPNRGGERYYFAFDCAAIAAAIADFKRSCARPYATQSPFESAV